MNNCFIYSSKINSTELLRTLSLYGNNVFNTRVLNLNDLLDESNIKLGFPISNSVLSNQEIEDLVLSFFINEIKLKNVSYQDIKHFITTLNNVRLNIVESDEKEVLNKICQNHTDNESLQLLNQYFELYLSHLGDDLDLISFAHKLIDYVNKNKIKVFDEIYYFKDDYISLLEKEVLKSLAKNVIEIPVLDLFEAGINNTEIKNMNPRYGVRNEVAHVIKDILENKYPLDECEIVLLSKSSYTNELYNFKNEFDLKMTFECGLPINLTDAFKLYKSIRKLESNSFYDVNGYLSLFSSESLDLEKLGVKHPIQVAQILGRMKICFDKQINDNYLDKFLGLKNDHFEEFELFMEKIDRTIKFDLENCVNEIVHVISEFSKGIAYVIKNFTKQNGNDEKLFNAGVDFIVSTLEKAENGGIPGEIKESFLTTIDNKYVCHEVFKDDSIHVTSVNNALSTIRKHVYILGMNSAHFPGSLTEDFLFSDNLYEELTGIPEITEKSLNNLNDYLKSVIHTNLALGSSLNLSYNCQEINEVRELNPCSVFLDYAEAFFKEGNEKLRNEKKEGDCLSNLKRDCSYYDDNLSKLKQVSDIAVNNDDIKYQDSGIKQIHSNGINQKNISYLDESYSPSTLPKFLKCPLRFYLDNIVGADNTITYDPLRPMSGNRFGDLLHYVMEHFVKYTPNASKDEIVKYASDLFDMYTSIDRSIGDDNLEKKPFINSCENAYAFLKTNFALPGSQTELEVGYKQEKSISKIGNIHFRGSIDLVTKDQNGEYVVIDYKTGQHIEHEEDDPETCIQGLIYAQLYEIIYRKPISKLMFFYTRLNKVVVYNKPCDESARKLLLEKVALFENALTKLEFPIANTEEQEEVCKYCKYMNICKKENKEEE